MKNKVALGKGSKGTVYSTKMHSKGKNVAIKEYQGIEIDESCQNEQFQ